MSRYLAEEPIDSIDDGLVGDLLRFIENPPSTGLNVVGLFGARGLGKTSYLRSLAARLRSRAFPLPSESDALFQPSRLDRVDELFADLVEHLGRYGGQEIEERIRRVHTLQSRPFRPDAFLKAANEEAGSRQRLADKLGDEARESARTTGRIRSEIKQLCNSIQPLVLLVDDLDLQPERALRLLDILHVYFDQLDIHVVVVLAADGDLLAESLASGLRRSGSNAELAWWHLQKLIPIRFHLPTWTTERGFAERLWPDSSPGDVPLAKLWLDLNPVQRNEPSYRYPDGRRSPDRRPDERPESDPERRAGRNWPTNRRDQALQALLDVAPRTPRGFKRLHNELRTLCDRFRPSDEEVDANAIRDLDRRLQMNPGSGIALRVMLLAADERVPFLGLGTLYEHAPDHLIGTFRRLSDDEGQGNVGLAKDPEAWLLSGKTTHIPLADRLRSPFPGGRQRLDALEVVLALSRFWATYRAKGSEVAVTQRLLALSFNADALESGRSLLEGPYKSAKVTHLDLRSLAPSLRPTPDVVRTAWLDLAQQVDLSRIADYQGPLGLISRAIYSLIVWLGWRLHRLRAITAYNFFRGDLLPFQGPTEVMRYEQSTIYFFLQPQDRSLTEVPLDAHEAVIIIDLIGRVVPTDLDTFLPEVPHRWLIGRPPGSRPLEPIELEPALRDIIELLGELHYLRQVDTFHLGLSMPDVAAFFLGQQLHEWGTIKLYEHSERGYEHTIDLIDPRDAQQ